MNGTFQYKQKEPMSYYRRPTDDYPLMNYSQSSSTSSSQHTWSPSPMQQRVHRKPVASNPVYQEVPTSILKSHASKSYTTAADTVHPNRIRSYSQVAPISNRNHARTRRHSQGTCLVNDPITTSRVMLKQTLLDDNQSLTSYSPHTITTTTTATTTTTSSSNSSIVSTPSSKRHTNFWYPRTDDQTEPLEPLKRGLSKKIRRLLQPQRTQIEQGGSKEQYQKDYQESLERCQSPDKDNSYNPFEILSQTWDASGQLELNQAEFTQIDNYSFTVQQRGPLLTPVILSQKFLTRPYKKEIAKMRALFIWLVQNIRPEYHARRNDMLIQKQREIVTQPPASSFNLRKRLKEMTQLDVDHPLLLQETRLDAMSILEEEATSLVVNTRMLPECMNESAEEVLEKRSCKSAFGMAHLLVKMALAAGFEDAQVVYGYLKGYYQDTTASASKSKLPINHAWCSVNIEGEYRMIDCWLASPFYPHNENKLESHWFLTRPIDMIMTHLPKKPLNQFLDPPVSPAAFFALPYVRNPFFWHRIQILKYHMEPEGEGIFYVSLKMDSTNTSCYAETEGQDGTTLRGLAQCLTDDQDNRICKIKAVLPPQQTSGWLKVYAGQKPIPIHTNHHHQEVVNKTHYPLALCIRISYQQPRQEAFHFVQLYVDQNEFYIQEPQCHQLYPLQTYHFCIKASRIAYRATHHKLALKSPSGKLMKLMYSPQDQTYDGMVTISEAGKWSLICLLHQTGGSYTVASWLCKINKVFH